MQLQLIGPLWPIDQAFKAISCSAAISVWALKEINSSKLEGIMTCCRRELPLPRILPARILLGIGFSILKRFRPIDVVKGLLPCGAQPDGNREH